MANTYKNNNALIIDFLSHNKEKDFLAMILSDDIISVDDALNIQIMKKNIQRVKEMHPHTIFTILMPVGGLQTSTILRSLMGCVRSEDPVKLVFGMP